MDITAKKRLKKAFNHRDFSKCIQIFKKYFDDTTLDSSTACIIGISYLYKFKFNDAKKYLNISLDLDNTNIPALLAMAALQLKQRNLEEATQIYLKINEIDDNKLSTKILNKLKKTDNIDKLIRKMKFSDYLHLPSLNIPILSYVTLIMIIVVITLLILTLIYFL